MCFGAERGTRGGGGGGGGEVGDKKNITRSLHDFSSKHCATPNYHRTSHPLSLITRLLPPVLVISVLVISIVAAAVRSTTEIQHQTA